MTRKYHITRAWSISALFIVSALTIHGIDQNNQTLIDQNKSISIDIKLDSLKNKTDLFAYSIADRDHFKVSRTETIKNDKVKISFTLIPDQSLSFGPYIFSFPIGSKYAFVKGDVNVGWAFTSYGTAHYHLGNTIEAAEILSLEIILQVEDEQSNYLPLPTSQHEGVSGTYFTKA